jgi:peptidase C39-like protein/uncharacterized protein DUF1573
MIHLALLLSFAAPVEYESGSNPAELIGSDTRTCGVNCVYVISRMMSKECSLSKLQDAIPPNDGGMNSFHELSRISKELGFHPVAVHRQSNEINSIPAPSILHVKSNLSDPDGDHFIIKLGTTDQGVVIMDPPFSPTTLPFSQLRERWTGRALTLYLSKADAAAAKTQERGLLAHISFWAFALAVGLFALKALCSYRRRRERHGTPTRITTVIIASIALSGVFGCSRAPEGSPELLVEDSTIDFGIVDDDTDQLRVKFSNEGKAPLRITRVTTSCTCTIGVATESLESGETGEIAIRPPKCGMGSMSARLILYSNAPTSPDEIFISWFCPSPPSLSPRRLHIVDALPGDVVERSVDISYAGGAETHRITVEKVTTSNDNIHVEAIDDELFAKEALKIVENQRAVVGEKKYRITWSLPQQAGSAEETVDFYVTQAGKQQRLTLPLLATMDSELSVSGNLIFAGKDWNKLVGEQRALSIRTSRPDLVPVVKTSPPHLVAKLNPSTREQDFELSVQLTEEPFKQSRRAELVLGVEGSTSTLAIPVFVICTAE